MHKEEDSNKMEDSNKVEDNDYDCGFCIRESDYHYSARPCNDCLMPKLLEVLKEIEGALSSIYRAIDPE
uniref:Uncharacterized protein n=1 Tax=viral metagenome TaxID=1070528 RepID=A0A6M3M481_9ZZZZ